jgi:hypothetical protein
MGDQHAMRAGAAAIDKQIRGSSSAAFIATVATLLPQQLAKMY